jgi:DNA-binding MarR family transcriptional regulator
VSSSPPAAETRTVYKRGAEPPFLAALIRDFHRALQVAFDDALRPRGLTLRQVGVLATLQGTPRLSNAELARGSFMAPQSMGDLLGSLEAAGLISRHPHPAGGRMLAAELTPAGVAALHDCRAVIADTEGRLLADLPATERRLLRDLLERCLASLRRTARVP